MVIISQDDKLDTLRMRGNKTGCFIVMDDKGTNYRMWLGNTFQDEGNIITRMVIISQDDK